MLISGCEPKPPLSTAADTNASRHPTVITTSYPLHALATKLAEEDFDVQFICAGHKTPRTWKPTSDDITALQKADLVLMNGAGYESWAPFVSLPRSRTINTSAAYSDELLPTDTTIKHQHGPAGDQSNSETAWSTWLRPVLLRQQLFETQKHLTALRPTLADTMTSRAEKIAREIDQLQTLVQKLKSSTDRKRTVLSDDSCCVYLATALDWELHKLNFESQESPESRSETLSSAIKKIQPDILLYQKAVSPDHTSTFEQSSVPSIGIDLCETEIQNAQLIERLTLNLKTIESAIDNLNAQKH